MFPPLLILCLAQTPDSEAPPDPATPMSLEMATEYALAHANEMTQARQDMLVIDTDYATALSAVLPQIDLRMSAGELYSRNRINERRDTNVNPNDPAPPGELPRVEFGPFLDQPTSSFLNTQLNAALTARQMIFDGGRWWTVIGQVENNRDAQKAALQEVDNLVRAKVARTFFGLERARQEKLAIEAQVDVDRAQVERADKLLQVGRGVPSDLAIARRNLASDEIQVLAADTAEGQARRAFNLQLGRRPELPANLVMPRRVDSATIAARYVPPLERLQDLALTYRPELMRRRASLAAGRKDIVIARADYYPTLAFEAAYNRSSRLPERIFTDLDDNYILTADFVLTWNLFQGFATNAAVDRAIVQLKKLRAEYAEQERITLSEVEDSRQRYVNQERASEVARRQFEAASEAVRLARGLYEAGRGTSLELRDAELGLTRARIAIINARLAAEIAYADLRQAVGTATTQMWSVR